MDTVAQTIQQFYDQGTSHEWERLERHPYEFRINTSFIKRCVQSGDHVLDIGGVPGRYTLHFIRIRCRGARGSLRRSGLHPGVF